MINITDRRWLDLIFGGNDECTCFGYKQEKLPYYEFKAQETCPVDIKRKFHELLDLQYWCYDLVCNNKQQALDAWSMVCAINGHKQGTPFMTCKRNLVPFYGVVTPTSKPDGII